jgi:hypothetical protein
MKEKILLSVFTTVFLSYLILANSTLAALSVKPAKLGILRLEIFPFSSATTTRDFSVGNTYDFPIDITLQTNENISTILQLSESAFKLQPNETKTVEYTITVRDPGIYTGGVAVLVKAENRSISVAYQADLIVIANKTQIGPEIYILPIIVVIGIAVFLYFRRPKRGKK